MERTLVISGTAIGCTVFLGLVILTACGVSMHDQQVMMTQLVAFITTAGMAGVGLWKSFKADQKADTANYKADDNKQAIGVVSRVAVDGFAGSPAAKQEAVKALNGTLPAPGSVEAKRPDAKV